MTDKKKVGLKLCKLVTLTSRKTVLCSEGVLVSQYRSFSGCRPGLGVVGPPLEKPFFTTVFRGLRLGLGKGKNVSVDGGLSLCGTSPQPVSRRLPFRVEVFAGFLPLGSFSPASVTPCSLWSNQLITSWIV